MKRIQNACLNQTIHFRLNTKIKGDDKNHTLAIKNAQDELARYKDELEKGRAKYKILEEKTLEDGSILIKIKKQLLAYDLGDYLD